MEKNKGNFLDFPTTIGLVQDELEGLRIPPETYLSIVKEYVRFLANARKPFKFTTPEGETVPALIKDCKFSNKAENKNFIEVDLEIQEFRYLGIVDKEGQFVGGNYNYGINKTANVLGRSVAKALFL